MIRVRTTVDPRVIKNTIDFYGDVTEITHREVIAITNDLRPELLANLRTEPGAVKYPVEWTSERQRRAFFATDGFGQGIPYSRTGRATAGWQVEADKVGDTTELAVSNAVPYAKYVFGTLDEDTGAAIRPQQRFHRNTGWRNKSEVVQDFMLDVVFEYIKRMRKIANAAISVSKG